LTFQGCFDLQTHEVVWVVKTPFAILIGDRQPSVADQGEQHVTGPDGAGDDLYEVIT
jgi:hypothetical protein